MLSNVLSSYRKVTQGTIINQVNFLDFIAPAFFEQVSAILLILGTAFIATVWVMIQLEVFLTPWLATVLQLIEQFNHCLPKQTS